MLTFSDADHRGEQPHEVFYRLVFYGGVDVYVFGSPPRRTSVPAVTMNYTHAFFVGTNPSTGTRYTDIKKSFSAACREAGITNFTFHDLRHAFGTRLADAGVDVVKIKELMGHASIVTTMRYIHATDQGKRGAITVLSDSTREAKATSQVCHQRKAAGPETYRKSSKIMVSRGGLEPPTR